MPNRAWATLIASGMMAASAAGQVVTIEARPCELEYGAGEPIFIDLLVSWDESQIGVTPGATPALAAFDFRLEFVDGQLEVQAIEFDAMLAQDSAEAELDLNGVSLSGFQWPVLVDPVINTANPITVATLECSAVEVPSFVALRIVSGADSPTVRIYRDSLGLSTFDLSIGSPGFETDGEIIFIGGGPCCTEPCNEADFAEPYETLDFSDVIAFLSALSAGDPGADLAAPFGTLDFSDVIAFLGSFGGGCP